MRCAECSGELRDDGTCRNCGTAHDVPASPAPADLGPGPPPDPVAAGVLELIPSEAVVGPEAARAAAELFASVMRALLDGYATEARPLPGGSVSSPTAWDVTESVRPVCTACLTPWEGTVAAYARSAAGGPEVGTAWIRAAAARAGARLQTPDTLAAEVATQLETAGCAVAGAWVTVDRPCAACRTEERAMARAIVGEDGELALAVLGAPGVHLPDAIGFEVWAETEDNGE